MRRPRHGAPSERAESGFAPSGTLHPAVWPRDGEPVLWGPSTWATLAILRPAAAVTWLQVYQDTAQPDLDARLEASGIVLPPSVTRYVHLLSLGCRILALGATEEERAAAADELALVALALVKPDPALLADEEDLRDVRFTFFRYVQTCALHFPRGSERRRALLSTPFGGRRPGSVGSKFTFFLWMATKLPIGGRAADLARKNAVRGDALVARWTATAKRLHLLRALHRYHMATSVAPPDTPGLDRIVRAYALILARAYFALPRHETYLQAEVWLRKSLWFDTHSALERAHDLTELGALRLAEYETSQHEHLLAACIAALTPALAVLDETNAEVMNRASCLLGRAFVHRHTLYGDRADVDAAISLLRRVTSFLSAIGPGDETALPPLAHALHARFAQRHDSESIEECLAIRRHLMDLVKPTDAQYAVYAAYLAMVLVDHHRHTSRAADLDEAMAVVDTALKVVPETSENAATLTGLRLLIVGERYRTGHDPRDRELLEAAGSLDLPPEFAGAWRDSMAVHRKPPADHAEPSSLGASRPPIRGHRRQHRRPPRQPQ